MNRLTITGILLFALLLLNGCDNKAEENERAEVSSAKIIVDDAYVLLDNKKLMKMYREYNEQLLKDFDIDFRVVTTGSDEDIDLFANNQFAKLQKESRSQSGKALLLVLNTVQDKARLEVSMALEPVYTDAFVSYVERKGMVPYLREYKIADGVYMVTELVRDRAYEAREGKEFVTPMQSKSIGGGAKTKAHFGVADPDAKKGNEVLSDSSEAPKTVLEHYINDVLKKHNKNPNLDIYTDVTKQFFAKWTVTEINQDHEVHNLAPCTNRMETLYSQDGGYAVLAVRPYDKNRKCSPYFFKKEEGKWKMDIATMAQMLRFNADMQWHFDMQKRLNGEGVYYAFAFDGFGFDKNGYPFTPDHPKTDDMRWGYQCGQWFRPEDQHRVKQNPKKYIRCWINKFWRGSPAEVRLGLDVYDYIIAVGENEEDANYKRFMQYMKERPTGSMATVVVNHYDRATKTTSRTIRHGITP